MSGAGRFCTAAMILSLAAGRLAAAELATTPPAEPLPPPPPTFYVHVGPLGGFPLTNAQPTGGGLFPTTNIAIRPVYTLGLEVGYFVTPNIAIELSTGVPPIWHLKATGLPNEAALGTNLLGSVRAGPLNALLRYQFNQFGPIQPYFGAGVGYAFVLANISDGILSNFSVDQNFGFVLQAGADWMLTPNWGVFVDGKKVFISTDAQGFELNTTVPVRAHIQVDPWLVSTGITFKY
jgi:outer membrane protein